MSQEHQLEDSDVDPGPAQTPGLPTRERDYVIPARDAHGDSVRLQCRAMPTIGRLISEVVASKKYPFRNYGDLIRWCVVTQVKKLAGGAGIESVMAQSDAIIAVLVDEEYQLQFKEMFVRTKAVVDSYMDIGATNEARRVVAQLRGNLERMPPGFWKERYLAEVISKYGQLLDAQGTGVNFGGEEDGDGSDEANV